MLTLHSCALHPIPVPSKCAQWDFQAGLMELSESLTGGEQDSRRDEEIFPRSDVEKRIIRSTISRVILIKVGREDRCVKYLHWDPIGASWLRREVFRRIRPCDSS